MRNFNGSIRDKEQKILNFYRGIGELSANKIEKTPSRKRTKKHMGGFNEMDKLFSSDTQNIVNQNEEKTATVTDSQTVKENDAAKYIVWD